MQKNTYGAIRLDSVHGYRLDGDNLELNAQLLIDEGVALNGWKLQLWAKDGPARSGAIKVAEVNLESARVTDSVAHLDARVDATLPPTGRYYDVELVLERVGADAPADVSRFSEPLWVTGPFLQGAVGYRVDGNRVLLSVGQVCNPRNEGNLSGTLALELWAVEEPYAGGAVRGHQLAGVVLGTLAGQNSRTDVEAELDFTQPPSGQWQVVLMLREWTAAGYVTRDYRCFDASYHVPAAVPERGSAAEATLATNAVEALSSVERAVLPTTAQTHGAVRSQPAAAAVTAEPVAAKPVAAKLAVAEAVAPAKGASKKLDDDARISVQTASVDELATIKGISKKVAQEIVRARPFRSLDELTRVKGIGDKTLRAVRNVIKL